MRTTIDGAGRVVVPKAIRDSLGIGPGQEFDIVEREGRIELAPVGPAVTIEQRSDGPVAVSDGPIEVLTVDAVRAVVERSRR